MRLKMVGMQFDKPRQQQIAAQVLTALRCRALPKFGDRTAGHGEPAALDHPLGEHDLGIGQDASRCSDISGSIVLHLRPSRGGGELRDLDDAVGNRVADILIMDHRNNGGAAPFLVGDQFPHGRTVIGIERCCRLVEQ